MLNTGGPRLLMLISGLMPSGLPMRFTIQHQQLEGRISSLHLSCLQSQRSCLTSITSNLLGVQSLSLTTKCNLETSYPSGKSAHALGSTSGCPFNTQGVSHWFSTSRLVMCRPNSMSPLIQSLKLSEARLETCRRPQNGKSCVDSSHHCHQPSSKLPSKMIRVNH